MARVKITLKCEHCGKEFEHIHMCRNSTEAGSYEVWARENLATCPACYAEQKNAKRGAELSSYISSFSDRHPLPGSPLKSGLQLTGRTVSGVILA